MRIYMRLLALMAFLLVGCAHAEVKSMVVLDYNDFGPQAAAYELLGMEWWQWQSHGESRPQAYNIKVVVYKDVTLDSVKQKYPVVQEQLKDYRYVSYNDAIQYLDNIIQENLMPELTTKLKQTKQTLLKEFAH
jgi:hypothetical protein